MVCIIMIMTHHNKSIYSMLKELHTLYIFRIENLLAFSYMHFFILLGKLAGKHEYVCNVHLSKMSPFWLKRTCDHCDQKKNPLFAFFPSSVFELCRDLLQFSS